MTSKTCYWPNGDIAANFIACDSSASNSACCPSDQPCTQNGLCYDLGYLRRGACTDNKWSASQCPKYCYLDDGSKQSGSQNQTNDILTCGNYILLRHFVCAKQNSWGTYGTNYCTSDTVFQFPDNGVLALATVSNTTAGSSSSSQSGSTQAGSTGGANAQPATTSASSDNGISGGTIGAAVVAAIMGLAFMITLGMLIATRRKIGKQPKAAEMSGEGVQPGPFGNQTKMPMSPRTELSGAHSPVHEMPGQT